MNRSTRIAAGALLIVVPLLFNVFFTLLSIEFSYPDILRDPTDEILLRFNDGGTSLVALWYGFALTPALFLPAALLLRRAFAGNSPLLDLATPLAIAASLTQLLGLLRWPFLVTYLSDAYTDPNASEMTRAATVITFDAFHRYAGVAVGEHLGYLFTASWTIVIAIAMLRADPFPTWLGWMGIASAFGVLAGMVEPAGFEIAGTTNAVSYIVWSLWLIVTGVVLLRGRNRFQIGQEPGLRPMTSAGL